MLTACGNTNKPQSAAYTEDSSEAQSQQADGPEDDSHNNAMQEAARKIYSSVSAEYRESSGGNGPDIFNLCMHYCSDSFNDLLRKANKISSANGDMLIDYDFWIMAQDWDKDLTISVESAEMTDTDKGRVGLSIHNMGTSKEAYIIMVLEHNAWKIDDFIDINDGIQSSIRDHLQDIIK